MSLEFEPSCPVTTKAMEGVAIIFARQMSEVLAARLAAGIVTDRDRGLRLHEMSMSVVDQVLELARSGLPDTVRAKKLADLFFGMQLMIGLDERNSFGSGPDAPSDDQALELQRICRALAGSYDARH